MEGRQKNLNLNMGQPYAYSACKCLPGNFVHGGLEAVGTHPGIPAGLCPQTQHCIQDGLLFTGMLVFCAVEITSTWREDSSVGSKLCSKSRVFV